MSETKIDFERIPGLEHIVRMPVDEYHDLQVLLNVLETTIDSCLKNGDSRIIIDLKDVSSPSTHLFALLVEATSRARRANGDVKIINLPQSIKKSLATFSAAEFLTLEKDSPKILETFDKPEPKADDLIIPATSIKPEFSEIEESLPAVDIVEDPIIERLENSLVDEVPEETTTEESKRNRGNHLRTTSEAKNLYTICDFVMEHAEDAGFNSREIGKTKIAVYEACLNVVEHAYHSKPDNPIDVWVDYDNEKFVIKVRDYGIGFEGFSEKSYDVVTAMDDRKTGGFGLYIIRRSMDELQYHPDSANGNTLTLVKYLNSSNQTTK